MQRVDKLDWFRERRASNRGYLVHQAKVVSPLGVDVIRCEDLANGEYMSIPGAVQRG
jgi:hypothetical protein